jgi:hypothetical protein
VLGHITCIGVHRLELVGVKSLVDSPAPAVIESPATRNFIAAKARGEFLQATTYNKRFDPSS